MFCPRVPSIANIKYHDKYGEKTARKSATSTAPLHTPSSSSGHELTSVVQSVQFSTSSQAEKRKQVSEKGKLIVRKVRHD